METIHWIMIAIYAILAIITAILFILYLDGYWEITSRKIVKSNEYNVTMVNMYGMKVPSGKETHEVHKITYANGRVKYVTKKLYH